MKMDTDIITFAEEIMENTGIKLTVFDESGTYLAGDVILADKAVTDFERIYQSEKVGAIFFKMKFRSKNFIGAVAGTGRAERNYAFLISELAEKDFSKNTALTKEEFFKAVLLGQASYFQIGKYMKKYAIADKPACVMLVSAEKGKTEDVLFVLSNYGAGASDFAVMLEDDQCAYVKFSDEVNGEYRSAAEYAEFLNQSIYEETGIATSIAIGGEVKTVYDLSASFSQAVSAKRIGKSLGVKTGVHSFKEYILVKIIEDLPKYKLNEYLDLLLDEKARDVFADEDMTETAEEFLEDNLNVSETSRKIYLHRNTLMYRLDKIEKATGLNIRKFSDAMTFRLITVLSKLVR